MQKIVLNCFKVLLVAALLAQAAFLLAEKIDLTTADLGRHITNGSVVLHGSATDKHGVLSTNFYSYTQTNFPTINHHWGSGVIFYWLTQIGGFNLDSIFYIALGVLTLLVMFDVTRKICNFWVALGLSSILLPLMMARTEVRPETITYFLSAVFFWVLWHVRFNLPAGEAGIEDIRYKKPLWILPIITLFWVNIHIGWFFGPLLIVLFLIGEVFSVIARSRAPRSSSGDDAAIPSTQTKDKGFLAAARNDRIRTLSIVLVLCGIAALINPNFIKGALEPLTIFSHYGYLIVENQSVRFLEGIKHSAGLHFTLLKSLMAILGFGLIAAVVKLRRRISIEFILLAIVVSVMAWFGLRNFPFFGFFALPVLAYCAAAYKIKPPNKILVAYVAAISLLVFVGGIYRDYLTVQARGATEGIGLLPGELASADFFKNNNIVGPIFNDYDVGGYLIYNLYPKEKVFVDNRPEAYSVDFFQNVYIPAQQDAAAWKKLDGEYNFNAIFFSYRDLTPWAQTFLIARVNDPAWAPVFVDGYNIIFLKRNIQNKLLIQEYSLPKSIFSVAQ